VLGELLHRRRAAETLRAVAELAQDLLVRVPLADAGLEFGECLRIDAGHGPVRATSRHGNQNRAYLPKCKRSLRSLMVSGAPTTPRLARCVSSWRSRSRAASAASRGACGPAAGRRCRVS